MHQPLPLINKLNKTIFVDDVYALCDRLASKRSLSHNLFTFSHVLFVNENFFFFFHISV